MLTLITCTFLYTTSPWLLEIDFVNIMASYILFLTPWFPTAGSSLAMISLRRSWKIQTNTQAVGQSKQKININWIYILKAVYNVNIFWQYSLFRVEVVCSNQKCHFSLNFLPVLLNEQFWVTHNFLVLHKFFWSSQICMISLEAYIAWCNPLQTLREHIWLSL